MPTLLAKDLLNHYDTVFSEATLKSHAESEKRRQARPLIATNYPLAMSSSLVGTPTTPTSTNNATNNNNDASSPPAASPTKQRRGLMSFMRNNNNSNETSATNNTDSNRWMGVFQRNNSVSSSSASTNSSSEQQRTSFSRPTPPIPTTATAITKGSPPSSPKIRTNIAINKEGSSSTPSPAITKVEKDKTEATTKQVVFDATEASHNDDGELDPFFDDD